MRTINLYDTGTRELRAFEPRRRELLGLEADERGQRSQRIDRAAESDRCTQQIR